MARQRKAKSGRGFVLVGGALFTLLPAVALQAQGADGEAKIADAQVEANVLKALASAPELSTQNIQSSTVYGTVTLTGNVQDEAKRTRAENLAARAPGVKKVVDELTIGAGTATAASDGAQGQADGSQEPVLQADGTYAPAPPQQPASPYQGADAGSGSRPAPPGYMNGQLAYGQESGAEPSAANGQPNNSQPNHGQSSNGQPIFRQQTYPAGAQGSSGQQPAYAPGSNGQVPAYGQPPYPQGGYPQPQGYQQQGYQQQGYQQQGYQQPGGGAYAPAPPYGQAPAYPQASGAPLSGYGQQPGVPVTVPSGALLRVRIDRGLDSNHLAVGTPFTGTVLSDVAGGGEIAIPRGATVQGTVTDAKKAGALKGEGELSLQLNSVTLGGVTYPLISDVWERQGRDKTVGTVNSALGFGVLGAIIGGVAGGGTGAAIGAGVGAGAGVAGSAGSPGGRIIIPPEAVLNFYVAQPFEVRTVSEGEMQRLAYAAGPGQGARPAIVRRYPYGYPPPPPGYYRY